MSTTTESAVDKWVNSGTNKRSCECIVHTDYYPLPLYLVKHNPKKKNIINVHKTKPHPLFFFLTNNLPVQRLSVDNKTLHNRRGFQNIFQLHWLATKAELQLQMM